jgi:hypothetical protein
MTTAELKKRLRLNFTFIIKNNSTLYPIHVLHEVLRSCFWDNAAVHWVIMTTTIAVAKLIALAYAWSQHVISYFLSTCGSTVPSSLMYQINSEDEFGNTDFKMLPRPQVCHFLYEYITIIDDDNNQRQSVLHLEKKWPINDRWFHLLVKLTGACVIDMHHLYRQQKKSHDQLLCGAVMEEDASVIHFSDLLCGDLKVRARQHQTISSKWK